MAEVDDWIKAGRIAAQARDYGKSLIKPGVKLIDVCNAVDAKIRELGAEPAFPAQISCDHIAAHFCPAMDDTTVFDKQVASLDVGVHVNGAIGDTAVTVDLSGQHADLVKASQDAVEAALKMVQIGTKLGDIGKAIQEVIISQGFAPIRNLSGHGLARFEIHTEPTIPNIDTGDETELEDGMFIAIEPFASTGSGIVQESGEATIFSVVDIKGVRSPYAKEVLGELKQYATLPWTTRWLTTKLGVGKTRFGIRELEQSGIIHGYPPLVDSQKGITSQAEHSVYVCDKPIVLTRSI
jgi:methionyl aminopeptidase